MTNKQYLAQCVIATSQGRARWVPSIKFSGTSAGKVWLLTDDQKFLLTITEPAGRRPRKEHLVKVPARYPADQTEALSFLGHSESVQTIIDKGNHNA